MKNLSYTTYTTDILLQKFRTTKEGLSSEQAETFLKQSGFNQVESHSTQWWQVLLRQFKSPFIYLLLGASVLSFFLGELIDALMILLFLTINTVLGFLQEYRSEKTIKLLNKYVVSNAKVIRNGKENNINVAYIVPGDLVVLKPGDIVPADIRLIESDSLTVDESVLTGESLQSEKIGIPLEKEAKNIYQAKNTCFWATSVVSGSGTGIVTATGPTTVYGDIAKLTNQTKRESTFEKQITSLSKFTLLVVGGTLMFLVIASVIIKRSPSLPELTLFSIALAVSVIPEALPVVTTFSLSIGALRLSKKYVVVKRLSAIEDLGSIEILCSDKTGTLTENILTVEEVFAKDTQKTKKYAYIASYEENSSNTNSFYNALVRSQTKEEEKITTEYKTVNISPFDPIRKRVSKIIAKNGLNELVTIGAWENVKEISSLTPKQKNDLTVWSSKQGKSGKRVIAIAYKVLTNKDNKIADEEKDLTFLGLISFIDPIKPTTFQAVKDAKKLGVKVIILTGDSKEVAGSVAYKIGLTKNPQDVLTGEEFDSLTLEKQHEAVEKYQVFARVIPQQKYKIIHLLQEKFEVGFLGEGINDAPALKIANVALVVQGASDIAKSASDIVLLKKSLHVIIQGIKEGRSVFVNTTKYVTATLSANFGNFFALAFASLVIDYLPMLPLQILLVNLLSDFPMISVATDTVDNNDVEAPTHYNFKHFLTIALLLGAVSTLFDFVYFGIFVRISPAVLQTAWFMGSILTELIFIFSVRTKLFFLKASRPSLSLIVLTGIAFFTTIVLPYTTLGNNVFRFVSLKPIYLLMVLSIVITYFFTTEIVKVLYYKKFTK